MIDFYKIIEMLPKDARPFVSYGDPLKSNIFIIGTNSATGGDLRWQDYWEPPVFHGEKWRDEIYLELRDRKPSPTWRNMKRLEDAASPLTFTETNVYSTPSVDEDSLDHHDTSVCGALLENSDPQLIILHGKQARLYMEDRLGRELPMDEFVNVHPRYDVLAIKHLSRGWSYSRLDELGREIEGRYNVMDGRNWAGDYRPDYSEVIKTLSDK